MIHNNRPVSFPVVFLISLSFALISWFNLTHPIIFAHPLQVCIPPRVSWLFVRRGCINTSLLLLKAYLRSSPFTAEPCSCHPAYKGSTALTTPATQDCLTKFWCLLSVMLCGESNLCDATWTEAEQRNQFHQPWDKVVFQLFLVFAAWVLITCIELWR